MKKLASAITALTGISFIGVAQAQVEAIRVNPFTGTLTQFVTSITSWIIGISGLIAVFYLIWGGYQYLTAGGDTDKVTKGRTTITNAVIGIAIVMIAFAIVRYTVGVVNQGSGGGGSNVNINQSM